MSSEAKRVKILTLASLFLGLALVVVGIVMAVQGAATQAPWVICGEGVLTLVFGGRGALIANVPARMGQLVKLALVVLLLQLACLAAVVVLVGPENAANEPLSLCAAAVPALLSLVICLMARGITKRAER